MADGYNEDWLAQHQAKMARLRAVPAPTTQDPEPLRVTTPAGRNRQAEHAAGLPLAGQRRWNATSYPNDAAAAHRGVTAGETAPKRSVKRPEEALQKQVAEFLDWALPHPLRWFHVPNQRGTRKKWENMLLKAMGVKEGVGDVIILGWRTFIWIELKSEKGVLSKAQRGWRDWCHSIGAPWFLCRSLDDVIEALQSLQIRLIARVA